MIRAGRFAVSGYASPRKDGIEVCVDPYAHGDRGKRGRRVYHLTDSVSIRTSDGIEVYVEKFPSASGSGSGELHFRVGSASPGMPRRSIALAPHGSNVFILKLT